MRNYAQVDHLERHLNTKHHREPIVEVVEYLIALAVLVDGVLGRQRHRAHAYHDHDEHVKVLVGDELVHGLANRSLVVQQEAARVLEDGSRPCRAVRLLERRRLTPRRWLRPGRGLWRHGDVLFAEQSGLAHGRLLLLSGDHLDINEKLIKNNMQN